MSDFYNKYPYTDFHELNLDWVIERVKKLTEDWLATHEEWIGVQQDWANTEQAWIDFKAYVENYLANLDVQDEIDHKINEMIANGQFETIIRPTVISQTIASTEAWLAAHITQPTTPVVDTSLTIAGAAADAAVTGREIGDIHRSIESTNDPIFLNWNYGYVDGNTGAPHPTAYSNTNRYTNMIFVPAGYTVKRTGYSYETHIYEYTSGDVFIKRLTVLTNALPSAEYTVMKDSYIRINQAIASADATTSFNPDLYVTVTKQTDGTLAANALSYKKQIIPVSWELGYIDASDGSEHTNTVNARTIAPVKLPKGSTLEHTSFSVQPYISIYNSNGTWVETITYNAFKLKYGVYTNTELYVRITVQDNDNLTNTKLTYLNSEYSTYHCYFSSTPYYSFIYDMKAKFIKPNYSKTEVMKQSYAPVCYYVDLLEGHTYYFCFNSNIPLNQQNFYLQIWETENTNVGQGGVLIVNYGNAWTTQDTSQGLIYKVTAAADYSGYFRFGYYAPPEPSGIIIHQDIYDLDSPIYYELNETIEKISENGLNSEYWKGKKIVWFGTSIPAGVINPGDSNGAGSYPVRIGQMLNATVYNESVGSSAARIGHHDFITASDPSGYAGVPATCCLYALSGTVAEKTAILNNWAYWSTVFTVAVSDIDPTNPDKYTATSYENKLDKYLKGGSVGPCDLYVFDHGYNDAGIYNGSDYSDLLDIPSDPLDRTYFIGAMNYLINHIKETNVNAEIVIISHYNDEGAFKNLVDAQSYVADKWNIPFINISNKMGFSTAMSVSVNGTTKTMKNWWLPDGIHPSSDSTGKALQHYAAVLYPMIRDAR